MHTGIANACNLRDGFGQLLFHGIVVTHLFHELTGGHGGHVFQCIHALGFCAGQAFGGQQHAGFLVFVPWHHDLAGVVVHLGIKVTCLQSFNRQLFISLGQHHGQGAVAGRLHRHRGQTKSRYHHQDHDDGQGFFHGGLSHQITHHAHGVTECCIGYRASHIVAAKWCAAGHHGGSCGGTIGGGQCVVAGAQRGIECCACGGHGVLLKV